jgi:hypothetical protein
VFVEPGREPERKPEELREIAAQCDLVHVSTAIAEEFARLLALHELDEAA